MKLRYRFVHKRNYTRPASLPVLIGLFIIVLYIIWRLRVLF